MTRPATVTFAGLLALFSALLWITVGLAAAFGLIDGSATERDPAGRGVVESVLGLGLLLVAAGLFRGSRTARLLTTVVMVLRIGVAIWAITGFRDYSGPVVAMLGALAVLGLLWNARADAYFRRRQVSRR